MKMPKKETTLNFVKFHKFSSENIKREIIEYFKITYIKNSGKDVNFLKHFWKSIPIHIKKSLKKQNFLKKKLLQN